MHIFFSGIGGTAIGPLAMIASQAGYQVSGSDKQGSAYIDNLIEHGITDIHIDQSYENIAGVNERNPIDWYVYTSALTLENPNPPELVYCAEQGIKTSKRDELLNKIITDKQLKLLAIAGTHGKTTTTSMLIWLFKQLGIPISYSVGAKFSFGNMGHYDPGSQYFIYEADEFDRNFLSFSPYLSLISGIGYDHQEIYPTPEDYNQAFRDFIGQSQHTVMWREDAMRLQFQNGTANNYSILDYPEQYINALKIPGRANRMDAWLVIEAARQLLQAPPEKTAPLMNSFPGLQRRMERIAENLYSDYAHTPEKIRGSMGVAVELAQQKKKPRPIVVVYEPLTDRRQHYIIDEYKDCFNGAAAIYWLPSYLAREDPNLPILQPAELISHLANPAIAQPAVMDDNLKLIIQAHLKRGDLVVGMAGGGGGSLDEWLRANFAGKK